MQTVANQRIVTVNNAKISGKSEDEYFCTINLLALENALQVLRGADNASAFKLWLYFSKNLDGYVMAVSSKHIEEYLGICDSAYRRAWKTLVKHGFLVDSGNNRDFDFIQYPNSSIG